jgi:hypothetical protein
MIDFNFFSILQRRSSALENRPYGEISAQCTPKKGISIDKSEKIVSFALAGCTILQLNQATPQNRNIFFCVTKTLPERRCPKEAWHQSRALHIFGHGQRAYL